MYNSKLDNKVKIVWLIGSLLSLLFPIALTLSFVLGIEGYLNLILGIFIPIDIIWLILAIILPFLQYRYYSYGFDEKRIYIKKGIIFRHQIMIPICQIQDLHIEMGPIMLMFKIGAITISTAGCNHKIAGVNLKKAEKIVQELTTYLEERVEALKDDEI